MRKGFILTICAALIVSGCTTSTGASAYGGASLGSILGSAIGGISGGPRGSDIGTIVGMAGGAVIGAAVGNAAEKAQQDKYRKYQEEREARYSRGYQQREYNNNAPDVQNYDESGFDPTNSGDDRITLEPSSNETPKDVRPNNDVYTTVQPRSYSPQQPPSDIASGYSFKYNSLVEIRKASFVDQNGDGIIRAGEVCKVTFEIMNRSDLTLYDVQPIVIETSGNKHIHVSPGLHVESIAPHKGVRYTATVAADKRLKDGQVVLKVAVAQGNNEITSQVKEFTVTTQRK